MDRTPFDNVEIIQARALSKSFPETIRDHSTRRQLLRSRIANAYYGTGAVKKDRVAVVVAGPPGAGKSMIAAPLVDSFDALLVDTDNALTMLPEYQSMGGVAAPSLIAEASHIAKGLVLPRVITQGDNFVMPIIGDDPDALADMAAVLAEADYETHLVLVHVDRDIATRRVVERFRRTGRFVDTVYVYSRVGFKPLRAYNEVSELGVFTTHAAFQNQNPYGHPPTLLDASPGSPIPQALGYWPHR